MITDEAKIFVQAGKGGDGAVSFRREKFVPKGGPDGGDGGDGGNVYFLCSNNVHTLSDFARKKEWRASDGERGRPKKQTGKNGEDLILNVPAGTIINLYSDEKILTHDFTKEGDQLRIASGGKGGKGNAQFATATRQTPAFAQKGTAGEERTIKLEMKLIADVGLIGLPNSGKSTLLSVTTNARPKIANYPFTTLEPILGVAKYHEREFILADIPGLIAGASKGKGLGDKFLRHIERTKILLHLIDINSNDTVKDYFDIRTELKQWSKTLIEKKEVVVLSKSDSKNQQDSQKMAKDLGRKIKKPVHLLSSASGYGLAELLKEIAKFV